MGLERIFEDVKYTFRRLRSTNVKLTVEVTTTKSIGTKMKNTSQVASAFAKSYKYAADNKATVGNPAANSMPSITTFVATAAAPTNVKASVTVVVKQTAAGSSKITKSSELTKALPTGITIAAGSLVVKTPAPTPAPKSLIQMMMIAEPSGVASS